MNLLHSTGQALTPNYPWHSRNPRGTLPPRLARVRPRLVLLLTLLLTSGVSFPSPVFLSTAHAGDVQYVYDDLGRLSAVVDDTTNEAALYQYDAVGNLLGITRQPANALAILNFTPKSGPVGTTVTVSGIGFSTTANQNTATFNGTPTTVSSATATQLEVTVPFGATTGPIAVTTPSGSATSSTPFTVTTSSATALPTITSFTPTVGAPGTPVIINGSNFSTTTSDNRVLLHTAQAVTTTATSTSLTTSVPAAATSGPITVVTPAGQAVSAADFFVPPASYTASAVAVTARLTFGQSQTVTLSTANTIALFLINATAGHRIGVNLTNVTLSASTVSITNPYGQVVASAAVTTAGAFVETPLLTLSGTYTIAVVPTGTATGSMMLLPHDIVDLTGPITSGSAMTMNLTTPGQQARLTFQATAGQRASVLVTSSTLGNCNSRWFSFREPDGTPWVEVGVFLGFPEYTTIGAPLCTATFMDAKVFQQTGTYQFVLDPTAINLGQVTLTLYVFDDVTLPVPFGTATTATTTMPGQNAKLTFAGTTGQRIFVYINNAAVAGGYSLTKPDGTHLQGGTLSTGAYLDTLTLPHPGTYTLLMNPTGSAVGSATFTVYDVPVDVTGTITPGTATTTTISAPGQAARLTFTGTAGQRASLRVNNTTISSGAVVINKPDGTWLASISITAGFLDAVTLPVSGTYTVVVDPTALITGQAVFTLYLFDDVTLAVPFGTATTATTTSPGQNAKLTFTGTTGQRVLVYINNATVPGGYSILTPDGVSFVGSSMSTGAYLDTRTLPQTGTYTLLMNPTSITVGSATFTVYDVPADVTGPITPGTATTAIVPAPGQAARLTFTGAAGQRASLRLTSNTISAGWVYVYKPDGTALGNLSVTTGFLDAVTLPVSGIYTVVVDPAVITTGQVTLTLYVFDDVLGALTFNGPAVPVTTTVPGQRGLLTFPGTATQLVTIRLTGNTMGTVVIRLRKPDGTVQVTTSSSGSAFNVPQQTLAMAGIYTVEIDPNDPLPINTGSIMVAVTSP